MASRPISDARRAGPAARLAACLVALAFAAGCQPAAPPAPTSMEPTMSPALTALPDPRQTGPLSLEQALAARRSVRAFRPDPLAPDELGQLLWAAQGITHPDGRRTAPSAGARFPLEVYLASAEGIFHYRPSGHALELCAPQDVRPALYEAALRQEWVRDAPAVFIIAAVYERVEARYGPQRGPRYVQLEAGHAAQNLLLQAVALDLGAVVVGAFEDQSVAAALSLPDDHRPLYLIPAGYSR